MREFREGDEYEYRQWVDRYFPGMRIPDPLPRPLLPNITRETVERVFDTLVQGMNGKRSLQEYLQSVLQLYLPEGAMQSWVQKIIGPIANELRLEQQSIAMAGEQRFPKGWTPAFAIGYLAGACFTLMALEKQYAGKGEPFPVFIESLSRGLKELFWEIDEATARNWTGRHPHILDKQKIIEDIAWEKENQGNLENGLEQLVKHLSTREGDGIGRDTLSQAGLKEGIQRGAQLIYFLFWVSRFIEWAESMGHSFDKSYPASDLLSWFDHLDRPGDTL